MLSGVCVLQTDWLITVYLDTAEMMVVGERPLTTGADLVADVGGMLGLLLGYSVFTFIGQLEAALQALVRRLSRSSRRRTEAAGAAAVDQQAGRHYQRSSSAPAPAATPADISTVFTTLTPRHRPLDPRGASKPRRRRRVHTALGPRPLRTQDTRQQLLL